jgi:hypothetical protein
MPDHDMDSIGSEAAAFTRLLIQLLILGATRARQRGQNQATVRLEATRQQVKEAQAQQIRDAHKAKAADPRNKELARVIDKPELNKEMERLVKPVIKPISLVKPVLAYDSPERRAHIAQHLAKPSLGLSPHLQQVRMLTEVGQAIPAGAAAQRNGSTEPPAVTRAREQEALAAERERSRH